MQNFCGKISWEMATWKTKKNMDHIKIDLRKVGCDDERPMGLA
jgi:hypothetical protein